MTDSTAAGRENRDCSLAQDGENGGHLSTKVEKVPQVEGAGDVEEEVPTAEAVLEFRSVFVATAPQLVSKDAKKEVKSIT